MFLFSLFCFCFCLFVCHFLLLLFDGIELFCWMLLSAYIGLSLFLWSDCFFLILSLYGSNLVLICSWMSIFYIFIYSSISIFIHGFLPPSSLIMPRFIAFLYYLYRFDCQIVVLCYMETIFLYFIRTLVALQLGVLCVELGFSCSFVCLCLGVYVAIWCFYPCMIIR